MTPTEKRLREALKPFAEIASNHVGEVNWTNVFVELGLLRRAREALAAIGPETRGEGRTSILGNSDAPVVVDMATASDEYSQGYAHGYRNGHHDGAAQLASLRERVVEECAKVVEGCYAYDAAFFAKKIRALVKSLPVSGEKEKSDG